MRTESEYGYEKAMRREQEKSSGNSLKRAAQIGLSGGVSGGLMSGAGSLLATANPRTIARNIGLGALSGAGIASGANIVGSAMIDGEDDPSINTRRGAAGGALVGGAAGGVIGSQLLDPASKISQKLNIPPTGGVGSLYSKLAKSRFGLPLGIAAGALGGAGIGAFFGSDEGMQYDVLVNEIRRLRGERV